MITHKIFSKNIFILIPLLLLLNVLAACGSIQPPPEVPAEEGVVIIEREVETEAPVEAAEEVVVEKEVEPIVTVAPAAPSAAVEQRQVDPLRAGSTDDNANWDDYLRYRQNYQGPSVHNVDVSERYVIEVQDAQGYPVMDAKVRIFLNGSQQGEEIYQARTYANGQVLFHPLAVGITPQHGDSFLVVVSKDNAVAKFTIPRVYAQGNTFTERWTARLDFGQRFEAINLDVLFLVDATGSMADEIGAIQDTIFDVSARIDQLPGQANVRYGLVAYRDRGDVYVSKTFDFVPNVNDFSAQLNLIYADGGGDYPESLNEGLHHALHQVQWGDENTIRLIFLIADAPPHLDYAQDYDYAVEMHNAARRAVKIFPIASSGLDDQGEYIFRQLAQYTQGRFVFLTYDGPTNRGTPGDVTTHHVDSYSVANLDDLLVQLVTQELAYQSPVLVQTQ